MHHHYKLVKNNTAKVRNNMKLTKEAKTVMNKKEVIDRLMADFNRGYETMRRWKYAKNTPFFKKNNRLLFLQITQLTEAEAFEASEAKN